MSNADLFLNGGKIHIILQFSFLSLFFCTGIKPSEGFTSELHPWPFLFFF